jgi:hypothetical protein
MTLGCVRVQRARTLESSAGKLERGDEEERDHDRRPAGDRRSFTAHDRRCLEQLRPHLLAARATQPSSATPSAHTPTPNRQPPTPRSSASPHGNSRSSPNSPTATPTNRSPSGSASHSAPSANTSNTSSADSAPPPAPPRQPSTSPTTPPPPHQHPGPAPSPQCFAEPGDGQGVDHRPGRPFKPSPIWNPAGSEKTRICRSFQSSGGPYHPLPATVFRIEELRGLRLTRQREPGSTMPLS